MQLRNEQVSIIARVPNQGKPLLVSRQVAYGRAAVPNQQLVWIMNIVQIGLADRPGAVETFKVQLRPAEVLDLRERLSCSGARSWVMSWAMNWPKKGQPAGILGLSSPNLAC